MFITGVLTLKVDDIKFSNSDIQLIMQPKPWQAHKSQINCVTWVSELQLVASCSYDCNVFMWNTMGEKIGSLVLGNKMTADNEKLEPDVARYRKQWKITVDQITEYRKELFEAKSLWEEVGKIDYDNMKKDKLEKKRKQEALA